MKLKHAVWPLLALLVFGVLLGIVMRTQDNEEEPQQPKISPLWSYETEAVKQVSATFTDRERVTIERRDGDYWLTAPRELPADQENGRMVFSWLAEPKPARIVEENASDRLAEFGLDEEYGAITVSFTDDQEHELLIGETSPVSQGELRDRYVRLDGSHTVYLFSDAVVKLLERSVDEWRDRDVLKLERKAVNQITVWQGEQSEGNFNLARGEPASDGYPWLVKKEDFTAPAAESQVEDFITALDGLTVEEFVEDEPADLSQYGLEPGYMKIAFKQEDVQEDEVVFMGSFADDKGELVYARNGRWPFVYTVSTGFYGQANPTVFNMLERTPLKPVNSNRVTSLTWNPKGDQQIRLTKLGKDQAASQAPWEIQIGEGSGAELEGKDAFEVLTELLRLQAADTRLIEEAEDLGLDDSTGILTVRWHPDRESDELAEITLELAAPVDDKTRYAVISGYDLAYAFNAEDIDELLDKLRSLAK